MKKVLKASLAVSLLGYAALLLHYHLFVKPFRCKAFHSITGLSIGALSK